MKAEPETVSPEAMLAFLIAAYFAVKVLRGNRLPAEAFVSQSRRQEAAGSH